VHARLLRSPWEKEGEKEKEGGQGKKEEEEESTISSVDHPTALRVRAALISDPQTAKKSLLGAWQGQAGTWDKLCRAYARGGSGSAAGSLPVAEAALSLSRRVDFEIPALRASTARGHQTLRDLERRAADCSKQAAAAARDYDAECSSLGISPSGGAGGVDGELRGLVSRELRPLLRSACEALRSEEVGIAVSYYAAFVRYAHGGEREEGGGGGGEGAAAAAAAEEPLLPALAAIRAAPSADLEDFSPPAAPAAASASASDSDAAAATTAGTEISWEIDVSSSGAEAESGGGGGEEEAAGSGGGIAWDIEVKGADDNAPSSPAALPAAASSESEKKPLDILSGLASDPSVRARLGDDLAELSAFLGQRLASAKLLGGGGAGGGATAADLPPDAPAALSSLSACEALQPALAALRAAEEALSGERASTLLLLGQPGGRGAARIAARLRARAGAEGKFARAAAAASARAAIVRSELAADARELRRAAAAARDAKKRAEEGVAAILGGNRKVNVVGEVSAALAAAERG
jgi:hypothetical protein